MTRINPRNLRWPIDIQGWAPSSWRSDAFDPAYDYYEPDVAPRKRPNLVIHHGFYDVVGTAELHGDLDNWA